MSETTSFNPSDEYINALLCKVAYEGVSVGDTLASTFMLCSPYLTVTHIVAFGRYGTTSGADCNNIQRTAGSFSNQDLGK